MMDLSTEESDLEIDSQSSGFFWQSEGFFPTVIARAVQCSRGGFFVRVNSRENGCLGLPRGAQINNVSRSLTIPFKDPRATRRIVEDHCCVACLLPLVYAPNTEVIGHANPGSDDTRRGGH